MRSDLTGLCPTCRLRLPGAAVYCPYCEAATEDAAQHGLQASSGGPGGTPPVVDRWLRWMVVSIAGPVWLLLPVAALVASARTWLHVGSGGGLAVFGGMLFGGSMLSWSISLVLVGAAIFLPVRLGLWIVEKLWRPRAPRTPYRVSLRDGPVAREESGLVALVEWLVAGIVALDERVEGYPMGRRGFQLAAAITFIAITAAGVLFEDGGLLMSLCFASVGCFVCVLGLTVWWKLLTSGARWIQDGPGLRRRDGEGRGPADPTAHNRAIVDEARADRARVRGAARASGPPIHDPVDGRPVLAFRVVGRVGGHEVDDAGATAFTVDTSDTSDSSATENEGQPPFEVQIGADVLVVLEPPEAPRSRSVNAPLAEWLRARGLPADARDVQLAVAHLREGDRVSVVGDEGPTRQSASGYRGTVQIRTLIAERGPIVVDNG